MRLHQTTVCGRGHHSLLLTYVLRELTACLLEQMQVCLHQMRGCRRYNRGALT